MTGLAAHTGRPGAIACYAVAFGFLYVAYLVASGKAWPDLGDGPLWRGWPRRGVDLNSDRYSDEDGL